MIKLTKFLLDIYNGGMTHSVDRQGECLEWLMFDSLIYRSISMIVKFLERTTKLHMITITKSPTIWKIHMILNWYSLLSRKTHTISLHYKNSWMYELSSVKSPVIGPAPGSCIIPAQLTRWKLSDNICGNEISFRCRVPVSRQMTRNVHRTTANSLSC